MKTREKNILLLYLLFVQLLPVVRAEMKNVDSEHLNMLKEAFRVYAAKNGEYPRGANSQIVQQLTDPQKGIRFVADKTDLNGNLIDNSGRPFLFLFSADGWVVVASLDGRGTAIEEHVLLPPVRRSEVDMGVGGMVRADR